MNKPLPLTEELKKLLLIKERELGFDKGFRLLYCPRETINSARVAFISLNPGRPPNTKHLPQEYLRIVSDEKGNSYVLEREITKSPITEQYLKCCEFLKVDPNRVLTGVIFPFRSNNWKTMSKFQKEKGMELGERLWKMILGNNIRLIISISNETTKILISLKNATQEKCIKSGWGNSYLRRFLGYDETRIIQLPHLSTYKLFSRPECIPPLKSIFEGSL